MLNKDFDDDQHHGQQLGVGAWNDIKCAGGGCCFSCGAIPDGISGKVRFEQSPEGGEGALWRSRGRADLRGSLCPFNLWGFVVAARGVRSAQAQRLQHVALAAPGLMQVIFFLGKHLPSTD